MDYMILYGFTIFSCCLGLLIFLNINSIFDKKLRRIFYVITALSLVLAVLDIIETYMIKISFNVELRTVECIFSYIVKAAYAVLFLETISKNKTIKNISYVLLLITTLCSCTAFFSDICFSINAANDFIRGPLNYVVLTSNFTILAFIVITALNMTIKEKNKNTIFFSVFCILCILASVLEFIVKSYGFINCNMVITVIFYYVYLESSQFKLDELTGVNNRLKLRIDIEKNKAKSFTILSIDVNNLKIINDTLGHHEGDLALKNIAHLLQKVTSKYGDELYRIGGDEFVVLAKTTDLNISNMLINDLKDCVLRSGYKIAVGSSIYEPYSDYDQIFIIADNKMYEDKKKSKEDFNITR